jgi:hypothetical protein
LGLHPAKHPSEAASIRPRFAHQAFVAVWLVCLSLGYHQKVASSFAPGQITRKAFQGRRKIDIFDFPQRTPSFIFRQQAYCGDELSETELWTLCSYLCEPFK